MGHKVYDCRQCGACCVPTLDFECYVDLEEGDVERLSAHYRRRNLINTTRCRWEEPKYSLATRREEDGTTPCIAFCGSVGGHCSCRIYDRRPSICHAFRPGSAECKDARYEHGLM